MSDQNQPETTATNEHDESPDSIGAVLRRLGPAAILGGLWAVFPAIGGILLLVYINDISMFLREHAVLGLIMYVVIFIFSAGLGALPTYSQSILAGFAFGVVEGFAAAIVGFTGASLVGYIVAQTIARSRMEAEIQSHPKAKIVRDSLVGRGFWSTLGIVTLIRVPPNSPFALTNLALAGAGVRWPAYVIGTVVGLAPRTFAAVYLAAQFAEQQGASAAAKDLAEADKPVWWLPANIAVVIVVMIVIGAIAKRALAKASASGQAAADTDAAPDALNAED